MAGQAREGNGDQATAGLWGGWVSGQGARPRHIQPGPVRCTERSSIIVLWEAMETGVWGLLGFGRLLWYPYPLRFKVYPWGIQIGPSSRVLAGITILPRMELPWQSLRTVYRRGRALRIMRDDVAPLTFFTFGDIERLVGVLDRHSLSIKVVRSWPV